MYKGYLWYALHNGLNYSVQITFYETIMKYIKQTRGQAHLDQHEFRYVAGTGFLGGVIGSALSNPFEVLAVCK